MSPRALISYDDTPGDHDALMLGRILADAGAELTLAYVRHCTHGDCTQEERDESSAELLLERGAEWFSGLHVDTRVVVSPSTAEGLRGLAEREQADIVVFGSDYRTAPGHVGSPAVDPGPARGRGGRGCDRARRLPRRVGTEDPPHRRTHDPGDDATLATARALADSFGATLTRDEPQIDLLVVGSRLEAATGA